MENSVIRLGRQGSSDVIDLLSQVTEAFEVNKIT